MMASTNRDLSAVGSLIWLLLFNPSLGLLNYVLSLVASAGRSGSSSRRPRSSPSRSRRSGSRSARTSSFFSRDSRAYLRRSTKLRGSTAPRRTNVSPASRFRWCHRPSFFPRGDTVAVLQAFTQIHLLTRRAGRCDAHARLQHLSRRIPNFQFGFASAESVVLFVLIMALTIIQFRFVERLVHYQ